MAIIHDNLWGGTFASPADTAITFTAPTAVTSDGGWVLCFVGCDNLSVTDTPSSSQVVAVTGGGVTWKKAGEWTNGEASAGAGAVSAIFYGRVASDVTANTLIVASFAGLTSNRAIQGMRGHVASGNELTLAGAAVKSSDVASISALTLAGLSSREYLFLTCVTGEETVGASFAEATNYNSGTRRGAGTNPATALGMRQAYRILTATGDTYDPATIATDWATLYVALYETAAGVPTTTTSTLDAKLQDSFTLGLSFAAILQGTITLSASIEAKLLETISKTLSSDAILQKTQTYTALIDAVLQPTVLLTTLIGATLQKELSTGASLDAIAQKEMQLITNMDATFGLMFALETDLDAFLLASWGRATPTTSTWTPATPA